VRSVRNTLVADLLWQFGEVATQNEITKTFIQRLYDSLDSKALFK